MSSFIFLCWVFQNVARISKTLVIFVLLSLRFKKLYQIGPTLSSFLFCGSHCLGAWYFFEIFFNWFLLVQVCSSLFSSVQPSTLLQKGLRAGEARLHQIGAVV